MIFFTYYNKNDISGLKKTSDLVKPNPNDPIENGQNTNTFENIEYKGIDLNGNRYVIMSEMASFDIDKPEEVKVMYAGCDKTGRTPENNSNDWKIVPNVDPEVLYPEIREKGTSI